jgi:hypothetical protein
MARSIDIDTSEVDSGIKRLDSLMVQAQTKALSDIAEEVMRLSSFEVPHDTGLLQNSGHVEYVAKDDYIVGYNKVYAARLHEHPEYRFQKGRKGKYLEDPIKRNLHIFKKYVEASIGA